MIRRQWRFISTTRSPKLPIWKSSLHWEVIKTSRTKTCLRSEGCWSARKPWLLPKRVVRSATRLALRWKRVWASACTRSSWTVPKAKMMRRSVSYSRMRGWMNRGRQLIWTLKLTYTSKHCRPWSQAITLTQSSWRVAGVQLRLTKWLKNFSKRNRI